MGNKPRTEEQKSFSSAEKRDFNSMTQQIRSEVMTVHFPGEANVCATGANITLDQGPIP